MGESLLVIVSACQAGCYICVRICVKGEHITLNDLKFNDFL